MCLTDVSQILGCIGLSACTHLTAAERHQIRDLEAKGISVDHPQSNWDKPANPGVAGALNLLPGFGNFYLASGNGADSTQWLLLDHGTKDSGLSFLHTTTNTIVHLL